MLYKTLEFLVQHFWKIFTVYLIAGLLVRTVIINDKSFDLHRFLIFSPLSILLFIGKLSNFLWTKWLKTTHQKSETSLLSSEQETRGAIMGAVIGITGFIVNGIPFYCIIVPPMMAIQGLSQFYENEKSVFNFIGLGVLATNSRLFLLVVWYFIGAILVKLEVYLLLRHWGYLDD